MKFVCSQSDLNSNLSLVSRAVPSRPSHPILANVLLEADASSQQVSLTGFDLSLGIRTCFTADVSESGRLTLPAKLLTDIVARLPEGVITLVCDTEGEETDSFKAILTCGFNRFEIRGIRADEFPELPQVDNGKALQLPALALAEGLRGVLFAASTDETKQILTGVHMTHAQDCLEFAATDGHRLAVVNTADAMEGENPNQIDDFTVTIPARSLRELERMISNSDDDDRVALQFDEGQVLFEMGPQRLTSRKLDGAYPAYGQLIPKKFSRQVTMDRKQLISSLELVAVLADTKNNVVKFSLDGGQQQLKLSVDSKEVGNGMNALPAQISGDDLDIAFNVKYLMDGLKALPSMEIQMQLNQNTHPVIFSPLGGLQMTYLVMPVQIRD